MKSELTLTYIDLDLSIKGNNNRLIQFIANLLAYLEKFLSDESPVKILVAPADNISVVSALTATLESQMTAKNRSFRDSQKLIHPTSAN